MIRQIACPNCQKAYLVNDEVVTTEWEDDAYYDECIGTCPDCNKRFWWTEKYILTDISEPKPINEYLT